jgi:hypothetical protein
MDQSNKYQTIAQKLPKLTREIFEKKISVKTGWGKNEIMIEYDKAVNEALTELLLNP